MTFNYRIKAVVDVIGVLVAIQVFCKSDGSHYEFSDTEKKAENRDDQCRCNLHENTHFYNNFARLYSGRGQPLHMSNRHIMCKKLDFMTKRRHINNCLK